MKRSLALVIVTAFITLIAISCQRPAKDGKSPDKHGKKATADTMVKSFDFKEYLEGGRVNFEKLTKSGLKSLENKLASLKEFDMDDLKSRDTRIAFWINAYNVFVIKILSDNYPKNSDMFKIDGFFDKYYINVGGNDLALNDISSKILKFGDSSKDPRLNFAISNGTYSSPKLKHSEYIAEKINSDLDNAAKSFLADSNNLVIEKDPRDVEGKEKYVVKVSKVFDWFESDFKGEGGVIKFLLKNVDKDRADFLLKNEKKLHIEYLPYNYDFAGFKK